MRKIECADCGEVFDQKEMNVTTNAMICDGCLERRERAQKPHPLPSQNRTEGGR